MKELEMIAYKNGHSIEDPVFFRSTKIGVRSSCKFGHCYYSFESDYVHIYDLQVYLDYRGKHKARIVLQKAIDKIRKTGYEGEISIVARPSDNTINLDILIPFYKRMGLQVYTCYK